MNKLHTGGSTVWLNKVPEATLSFWIIKIMSTTVGETGADFLAVNAGWGQGVTSSVMAALLAAALLKQLRTHRYTPWIYWLTVVLASVVGTQITDLLTDGLGVSLYISTSVIAALLAAIFSVWGKQGKRKKSYAKASSSRRYALDEIPTEFGKIVLLSGHRSRAAIDPFRTFVSPSSSMRLHGPS